MATALGAGGGAGAGDDDFDQFDKPGAERSWRRRAADEDWDSELEDDLLGEDLLTGKKNQSDLSDEELNDDLLQSDNEDEENFSSQGVTISLNTTSGMVTSFELSDNTNDQSGEQESEYEQGEDELVYHKSDGSELYAHEYPEEGQYEGPDAELTEDHMEYVEEPEEGQLYNDEVLDIEINEPLDEFTGSMETLELQKDVKEESDEEDEDDEESGRLRFKTERKEGTIIRLSDVTRERRNIPETLGNFFCLSPIPFQLPPIQVHSHFTFLHSTVTVNQILKKKADLRSIVCGVQRVDGPVRLELCCGAVKTIL
uniref:RNA binding motif protein 33 n=1 Tax=Sus scrofa TaxID=9823 RepID=A0A8W4FJ92_PIG